MNTNISNNYTKLNVSLFYVPLFLLVTIALFLYQQNALNAASYSEIQKDGFFFINSKLSQFPIVIYNLTQLGDALIFLSILSVFIISAPKMWEALLSASLFSLIFSNTLKNLFSIPRPAATFDNNTFTIIGKTLSGHSSLPSGHSITVFTILTVILFSFMPKKVIYKILWFLLIISLGLCVAFTRVGVGAHYPIDVIVGSIVGYISGLLGIFTIKKYGIFNWVNNKKYYPIFIVLFVGCGILLLITRIFNENLLIFHLALSSLIISLYKITSAYVQK